MALIAPRLRCGTIGRSRIARSCAGKLGVAGVPSSSTRSEITVTTTAIDERISARTRAAIGQDVFGHVIDGERVAAGDAATMDVVDPATGDVIAAAAAGTVGDVDRAARSGRAAFEDGRWRDVAPMAKEKVLRNM